MSGIARFIATASAAPRSRTKTILADCAKRLATCESHSHTTSSRMSCSFATCRGSCARMAGSGATPSAVGNSRAARNTSTLEQADQSFGVQPIGSRSSIRGAQRPGSPVTRSCACVEPGMISANRGSNPVSLTARSVPVEAWALRICLPLDVSKSKKSS